jgi:hypothetical protein
MGIIDESDIVLVEELAISAGISAIEVRAIIARFNGDEFKIRNYLQNLVIDREIIRKHKNPLLRSLTILQIQAVQGRCAGRSQPA